MARAVDATLAREARANESQKLLNWGFTAFDPVRLFDEANRMRRLTVEVLRRRD